MIIKKTYHTPTAQRIAFSCEGLIAASKRLTDGPVVDNEADQQVAKWYGDLWEEDGQ